MEKRWFWGAVLYVAAFGFYLHGAAPSVTVGDSGEFITAAHTLGISHPPAYPAYTCLAHFFSRAIPWANIGFRVNLFSSFCGALAVVCLFGFLSETGLPLAAACFGAVLFLFVPSATAAGRVSEVFALNSVCLAGLLWAAAARRWLLAGLLLGLGMANHQTIVLVIPALAAAAFVDAKNHPSARIVSWAIIATALGFCINAFILIRAAHHPFLNVGHGETLETFIRILRRADYGSLTLALGQSPPFGPQTILLQLIRFGKEILRQTYWLGALLAVIGFARLLATNRRLAWMLLIGILMFGPFFFLVGNLPFDAQSNGLLQRFYIAPALCACALAAFAVADIRLEKVVWVMCLCVPGLAFSAQGATLWSGLRHDYLAYDYGRNTLKSIPENSLLLMDGGDDTFYSLAYLTQCEHRRPDVELHDRGAIVFGNIYGDDFRMLDAANKEARRQSVESSLVHSGRPLAYATMNPQILKGVTLRQCGIVYQTGASPNAAETDPYWGLYALRGVAPWMNRSTMPILEYRERALVPYYAFQRAVEEGRANRMTSALGFLDSAHIVGPDVVWLIPNIVNVLHLWAYQGFQSGKSDEARGIYERILRINSADATAWMDLGTIEDHAGRWEAATHDFQESLRLDPSSASAHFNFAVSLWKQQRWADVVRELKLTLAIDPNYPKAAFYLNQANARSGT